MINGMRKIAVLAFAAAAVLAACNNSSTTVPPAGGGTTSGGSSSGGQIATADVTGIGKVLEAPSGFTLYHLTSENNGTIQCTGSCASTWPPLLAPGGQAPTSMGNLPKTFSTVSRPDGGVQVTYNGYPLYTYSGDTGPGQSNGNGISGTWYAVTPTGDASGSTGGTGGGTGYGGGGGGGGY